MRIPAILAVLGATALTGQAHAAERLESFPAYGSSPVAGVMPIGSEVAYGHRLASSGWWLGTTERTVAELPAPPTGQVAGARLAASADRFAWTRTRTTVRQQRIPDPLLEDRLFSARPPGEPAQADDCALGCRISLSSFLYAVDGTTLAWLRTGYRLTPLTIDHGDGRPPRQVPLDEDAAFAMQVAAAGGRIAYSAQTRWERDRGTLQRIVVLDGDGNELFRVTSSASIGSWALQPDGKLVVWGERPAWYTEQEPFAHAIPYAGDGFQGVIGAAGDRIAIRGGDSHDTLLRVVGLDGSVRTVARMPYPSLEAAGFDGTTLAWGARRCGVVSLWTAPAAGSDETWEPAGGACPEFAGRRPLLGRTRVVVRLTCPLGCRGTVSLVLRDRPAKRYAARRVAFAPSGRPRLVRLTVARAAARALRRDPPVLLQRFAGRDRTGEPAAAERVRSPRPVRG